MVIFLFEKKVLSLQGSIKNGKNMKRESLKNLHKKYRELQKQGIKTSVIELGIECGYTYDEIKMKLIKAQQTSTYVSKSVKRNRRRQMRKQLMKERYNL
jgi:hypothetical protein